MMQRDRLHINDQGHVHLDGRDTALAVAQHHDSTVVWRRGSRPLRVQMPQKRYSLVTSRAVLITDLIRVVNNSGEVTV